MANLLLLRVGLATYDVPHKGTRRQGTYLGETFPVLLYFRRRLSPMIADDL